MRSTSPSCRSSAGILARSRNAARRHARGALAVALLAVVARAQGDPAALDLPALLGDHAVFQRGEPVEVWGRTRPDVEVRVTASWGHEARSRSAADGWFALRVQPADAPGPHELVVAAGGSERRLRDLWFGDVWLCGGQSNMEWTLGPGVGPGIADWQAEVAAADDPKIRVFDVPNRASATPQERCDGAWQVCTPQTAGKCSAVAILFARALRAEIDVPIGLMVSCWGGTRAEAWTPEEDLAALGDFAAGLEALRAIRAGEPGAKLDQHTPSALWNGMIAPLRRCRLRGVIFYQGESNVGAPLVYRRLFPALIGSWRTTFAQPDLPFYYVQIAPFAYQGVGAARAAFLREAQAMAMATCAHVGMAVTMDIGDPKDIHPANKQDVARRLALWALTHAYGRDDLDPRGPELAGFEVEGSAIRVRLRHAEGLTTRDGAPPRCFMIAGEDRVFHPAEARIEGETVVVRSASVERPVAVRHGFGAADVTNLVDGDGLPAGSFRTDDWPPP
ncbi:MAG TPA: sialate O-acetylesterase [Planctomycetota bacterium]|nr:sialate O-acetylesterase [Planctomycetota bacterium]